MQANTKFDEGFDNFYSLKETGAMIRAGRSTLYNLIRDGKLQAFKLGAYNYVRASEVRRYLAAAKPSVVRTLETIN